VAHADADALAVEVIAASWREEKGVGGEGGGVAEEAAEVVVIGEVFDGEYEAGRGRGAAVGFVEERVGLLGFATPTGGDEAAVDGEAGDAVHDGLRGFVDREVRVRARESVVDGGVERVEGDWRAEDRDGLIERANAEKDGDDETSFGDEEAVAFGDVRVAHLAVGGEALVVGVVDGRALGTGGFVGS